MFCKMRSGNNLTCDKSRPWGGFLLSATAFYHVVGVNGMIEKISPFSITETFARLEKPKTQEGSPPRVRGILRAGLSQILIDAGADINVQNDAGYTPLGVACWRYAWNGAPEYLDLINTLLEAGACPKADETWKKVSSLGSRQARSDRLARRDWLEAYIASWG